MNLPEILAWSSSLPHMRNTWGRPRSVTSSLVDAGVMTGIFSSLSAWDAGMAEDEQ